MDNFQPLRDTIGLLAGTPVRRTNRPGEQFEMQNKPRIPKRTRSLLTVLIMGLLIGIRIL